MNVFLLLNTNEDVLKNMGNKQLIGPIFSPHTTEVNGAHQLFGYEILQDTFCVLQKKDIHTNLEKPEGE